MAALLHLLRRDPRTCGVNRSRWRLVDLLGCCPWLRLTTPRSLGRLLARMGIAYKRGRDYVHSPDPDYTAKLAMIGAVATTAQVVPERVVLLYLDELTVYRQPTIAPAWATRGCAQPLACRSHASNTPSRIVGALDAGTGQLHSLRAAKLTVPRLVAFYQQVRAAYPEAERLWLVLDNWPVHFHPDLLAALEPQHTPFPLPTPPTWPVTPSPAAQTKWGHLQLPIQLLPLPTYASWCNPIEKVWRKLRQELGHLHPWADDLARLRAELDHWLLTHHKPSPELLRYVGIETND
jgi:hypothetical protein